MGETGRKRKKETHVFLVAVVLAAGAETDRGIVVGEAGVARLTLVEAEPDALALVGRGAAAGVLLGEPGRVRALVGVVRGGGSDDDATAAEGKSSDG